MNEYDTVKSLFPGPLNDQGKEDLVDAFESGLTLSCISSIEDPEDNPTYESFSAQLLRFHQNQKNSEKSKTDINSSQVHSSQIEHHFEEISNSLLKIERSGIKDLIWFEHIERGSNEDIERLKNEAREGHYRSPLHGLPVGIKDIYDAQGFRSTWGSKHRANSSQCSTDSDLSSSLKKSGCVILGKQHTAELAMSPTGFNENFGQGINPNHPDYISGGSSSGAAMSVAAKQVSLAYGSDTGGSVRLPAALCGLVGMKPTHGRFRMRGAMPLSPSLDCPGPIAHSVDLCGMGFMAMAADWPLSDGLFLCPWRKLDEEDASVSIPDISASKHASSSVKSIFSNIGSKMEKMKIASTFCREPDMLNVSAMANIILSVEALSIHKKMLQSSPELFGRQVRRRLLKGFFIDEKYYVKAKLLRSHYLSKFIEEYFNSSRVLVLPTIPDEAPTVHESQVGTQKEVDEKFSYLSHWTRAINYLGLPSITVPFGVGENGLPLGIQLIGKPFDEMHLLSLAYKIEKEGRI